MFDIHQSIRDEYGEGDEDCTWDYIEGLISEFAKSSEWQSVQEICGHPAWAAMMMEYAINYVGCTPPEMTLRDFNDVVFSLFPRKVSVEADEAGLIITELRAFWSFLSTQYGLKNARVVLAALDDRAVSRLHEKLSNPDNFGMAKSFFMMGSEAGFDMRTREGLAAFQVVFNAKLRSAQAGTPQLDRLPAKAILTLPPPEQRGGDALKKKRKEKKRQREAKKRNRPR
jgi:hypothetical protein